MGQLVKSDWHIFNIILEKLWLLARQLNNHALERCDPHFEREVVRLNFKLRLILPCIFDTNHRVS